MPPEENSPKSAKKAGAATSPDAGAAVELTAAEAAKAVRREVPVVDDEGKPTGETKQVEVAEDELFAWALRGDRVVVCTTDGQKLVGSL